MLVRDLDYNRFVDVVGTMHFTRRSILDAYRAVGERRPRNLALELDRRRFKILDSPYTLSSVGLKSEFNAAADALGNIDANIWLIDVSQDEISRRIRSLLTPSEANNLHLLPKVLGCSYREVELWEHGAKEAVMGLSQRKMEKLKEVFPTIWIVLMHERNIVMGLRLIWIVEKIGEAAADEASFPERNRFDGGILALVGAAHVQPIRNFLANPSLLVREARLHRLKISPPFLIKRIKVE